MFYCKDIMLAGIKKLELLAGIKDFEIAKSKKDWNQNKLATMTEQLERIWHVYLWWYKNEKINLNKTHD